LQAQHLLSRSSPERKAVGARGRLQDLDLVHL
jgi:hypothetical protein